MSNSAMVVYTKLSPHFSRRTHKIDTITIHCMAGNGSVETCGEIFQQQECSSNYGVGSDGRVALYVEEDKRSWCSSNSANDDRAITIEVANCDGWPDWPVTDAAYAALIELCADICQRNGIDRLRWRADPSLAGQVEQQNMTAHRWFANKACPGNYLYDRFGAIAAEVNRRLEAKEDEMLTGEEIYRRLTEYLSSQPTSEYAKEASRRGIETGAFMDGDNDGLVDNPKGIMTRQDFAVVLDRLDLLKKHHETEDDLR